jgi:hypothetical protein
MELFCSSGLNPISLIEFYAEGLFEKDAFLIERELINKLKSDGVYLKNKMIYSPHTKTEEWKQKIRLSNVGKHNHYGEKNPNAKPCTFIPTGRNYATLKQLCDTEGLPYSSVKSSLHAASKGKKSKYYSLIKFKNNVAVQV